MSNVLIGEAATDARSAERPIAKPRSRVLRQALWILLCLVVVLAPARSSTAWAADDNENSAPTAWWIYTGQSFAAVNNTIAAKNARIIDISVDNPDSYTVTYVRDTGAYAKKWWWYVGIDSDTLAAKITENNGRLISLKAYDIGGGEIRFAVAMISNTGADAKGWWYYFGQSPAEIGNLVKANHARLTALQSYNSNGQTQYAIIMIANNGADAKGWWWFFNVSPEFIGRSVDKNKSRILDLTYAGGSNFNAVMEACSSGCPSWWWRHGLDANAVLSQAQNNRARILTAQAYPGCSNACFVATMIGDSP